MLIYTFVLLNYKPLTKLKRLSIPSVAGTGRSGIGKEDICRSGKGRSDIGKSGIGRSGIGEHVRHR